MIYIKKHFKKIFVTLIFIIILFLGSLKIYLYKNSKIEEEIKTNDLIIEEIKVVDDIIKEESDEETTKIFVDIKGAVLNPGVYEIEENKKVIDVVNLAGGLSENADTTLINLAKKLTDEMVVIIYTKEEVELAKREEPIIKIIEKECVCPEIKNDACLENVKDQVKDETTNNETTNTEPTNKKININTATLEELLTLSGIGESKAKAIIEYRNEAGKFNDIEEIKKVTGIGETLYESIKENITV